MKIKQETLDNSYRKARIKNNLTIENVSKLLNISKSTISKIESNVRLPSLEVLISLHNLYKVSYEELLESTVTKLE